jgi:hypothetical protein
MALRFLCFDYFGVALLASLLKRLLVAPQFAELGFSQRALQRIAAMAGRDEISITVAAAEHDGNPMIRRGACWILAVRLRHLAPAIIALALLLLDQDAKALRIAGADGAVDFDRHATVHVLALSRDDGFCRRPAFLIAFSL